MSKKLEVLVVDDEEVFRDVIGEMLEKEGYLPVKAASGHSAIKVFKHNPPAAVFLDLNMPEMDGKLTMHEIKKLDSSVPVIFVTASRDIDDAVEMVKCGAFDFITKPPDFEKLINVLNEAIEEKNARRGVLTFRQKQILEFISQGKSSLDIAELLEIKEVTVKFHIDKLVQRLNAANRAHAVAIAIEKKLINPDMP